MRWPRSAPSTARDWRTFDDNLAPIVAAELDRGNTLLPPQGWQQVVAPDGRGEREWRLRLRFPLDTDAIDAEFVLPENVYARAGALVWGQVQYHVIYGEHATTAERVSALADWWQRWRAAGSPRTVIAALPASSVPAGGGPSDTPGTTS
jgi:hypothetical protein